MAKRMLRRYDLCERAVRRLWADLLRMNRCRNIGTLVEKILKDHPTLDRRLVEEKLWEIRGSEN